MSKETAAARSLVALVESGPFLAFVAVAVLVVGELAYVKHQQQELEKEKAVQTAQAWIDDAESRLSGGLTGQAKDDLLHAIARTRTAILIGDTEGINDAAQALAATIQATPESRRIVEPYGPWIFDEKTGGYYREQRQRDAR